MIIPFMLLSLILRVQHGNVTEFSGLAGGLRGVVCSLGSAQTVSPLETRSRTAHMVDQGEYRWSQTGLLL